MQNYSTALRVGILFPQWGKICKTPPLGRLHQFSHLVSLRARSLLKSGLWSVPALHALISVMPLALAFPNDKQLRVVLSVLQCLISTGQDC
jgi:hypothetical protein